MPSVKIPRKSTDTDMTPFVDIGFLILSFFIMATKFKPNEPVAVTTPNSVNSDKLAPEDAILITIAPDDKVYFTIRAQKDQELADAVMDNLSKAKNLNLTPQELKNSRQAVMGMPFTKLKGLLDLPIAEQAKVKQDGIPVLDSASNELVWWIGAAKATFAGKPLKYLIKGDNKSKYPTFKGVVDALKRNDELKYHLVTMPEEAPGGSELSRYNAEMKKK